MPDLLNLFLAMVGDEWPKQWNETIVFDGATGETFDQGLTGVISNGQWTPVVNPHVISVGTPTTRANPTVQRTESPRDGVNGYFQLLLATRMDRLLQATIKAGKAPFYDALTARHRPFAWEIGSRDLLCYICKSKRSSIIKRFNPLGFQAHMTKDRNCRGFTSTSPGQGVCSEVYLDDLNYDIRGVQNAIYHEWMHNKTNFDAGEDINWVHTNGGGGLAADPVVGGHEFLAVNQVNAQRLGSRLRIANRQYVAGLALL